MQIDELRGELATLADEIAPFAGDVRSLHRRQRRRRVVTSSFAVALTVVVAFSVIAVRHRGNGRVHVAAGSKEVAPAQMSHIDAIVVPDSSAAREALDASPLVSRFARIPAADRSAPLSSLTASESVKSALCRLQTSAGYAVDAAIPGPNFNDGLTRALAGVGTVTLTDQFSSDLEVFMQIGIAPEYSLAIRGQLASDPNVQSFRYLSNTEAYEIFKKDFADQPALVQSTKPSDLPESFRVMVKPGRSVTTVVDRYQHRDGVDTVITPAIQDLFDPTPARPAHGRFVSPCTSP